MEEAELSPHDTPTVRPPGYSPRDVRDTREDLPDGGFDDEPTKRYSSSNPLPLPSRVPVLEAPRSRRPRRTGG